MRNEELGMLLIAHRSSLKRSKLKPQALKPQLRLTLGLREVDDVVVGAPALEGDFAEVHLIFVHVLFQGEYQLLGILGSHDDAALHARLGVAGRQEDEVEHKFIRAVRDDGEVGVASLHFFLGHLDLDLVLVLFFV